MESIIQEKWKDISDYEGIYQISNYGRVRSLLIWDVNYKNFVKRNKPKILMPTDNGNGYLIINLSKDRKRKSKYIHRLVAQEFIRKPLKNEVVNHKDYNKKNNRVDNLEWCTQKENISYSVINMYKQHGTKPPKTTGEKYIRKKWNSYELSIGKKYIGNYKTLEEAKNVREKVVMQIYGSVNYSK